MITEITQLVVAKRKSRFSGTTSIQYSRLETGSSTSNKYPVTGTITLGTLAHLPAAGGITHNSICQKLCVNCVGLTPMVFKYPKSGN